MPSEVERLQAGSVQDKQESQLHGTLSGSYYHTHTHTHTHMCYTHTHVLHTHTYAHTQIYEILFQEYVNRMNFKVRMRKLDIRSIRAPPAVRLKLIELNALPPNCPVCGLVKVSEVEHLAKSYGVVLPAVFTEELITAEDRVSMCGCEGVWV